MTDPFTIELWTATPLDGEYHWVREPDNTNTGPLSTIALEYADTAVAARVIEWSADGRELRVLDPSRVQIIERLLVFLTVRQVLR